MDCTNHLLSENFLISELRVLKQSYYCQPDSGKISNYKLWFYRSFYRSCEFMLQFSSKNSAKETLSFLEYLR